MNAAAKRQNLAAVARRLVDKAEVVEQLLFGRVRVEFDADEWAMLADALEQLEALPVKRATARRLDPPTSYAAGPLIEKSMSELQAKVVRYYSCGIERSARQLELSDDFAAWGFSTLRKRVSELASAGWLEPVGVETKSGQTPATVYRIAPSAKELLR